MVIFAHIQLIAGLLVSVGTGVKCHGTTFCSVSSIPYMQRSINYIPSNAFVAIFSSLPNPVSTCISPINTNRGTRPSTSGTLQLVVCRGAYVIDLMDSFLAP